MYTVGHSRLISTGIYIPKDRITSHEIMQQVKSDERFGIPHDWLERVTGIRERRVTPDSIKPSDMAAAAALEALEIAKVLPKEIDVIIYCGVIRDYIEPATAHIVQHKIGANKAVALDISNACLGFMSALHLMDALIATGQARRGLVITGEKGSAYTKAAVKALDQDPTRKLFDELLAGLTLGDAGAAVVVGPKLGPDSGFMGFIAQSQGEFYDLCICGEGPLRTRITEIVTETAKLVGPLYQNLMAKLDWKNNDIIRYIPHQVGLKSIKIHAALTGLPLSIMPVSVDVFGNVVSATIPLNIYFMNKNKELKEGNRLYLSGTGSGICLGQAGLVWDLAA